MLTRGGISLISFVLMALLSVIGLSTVSKKKNKSLRQTLTFFYGVVALYSFGGIIMFLLFQGGMFLFSGHFNWDVLWK